MGVLTGDFCNRAGFLHIRGESTAAGRLVRVTVTGMSQIPFI